MSEQLKTLPHSAEAERGIIGSILLDATMGDDSRVLDLCQSRGLTPASFYEPRNRVLFETFREMGENQKLQGLGLSICKAIINLLGGQIWLDVKYVEGSRFIFELPNKQEKP